MSGVRSEPVEVWVVNGRPARFVWRERLYTVLSVIERPEGGGQPEGRPTEGGGQPEGQRAEGGGRPGGGNPAAAGAGPEGRRVVWRCWRVTASAGRNVPANTYRLCHDQAADRWRLSRNGR